MAQFDVHRNAGRSRKAIPFVVVVQSSAYDEYARRVVVPLVRKSYLRTVSHSRLNPTFTVGKVSVVFHPLEIVSISGNDLGDVVGSLAKESDQIIDALDELLSRAWG